MKRFAFRFLSLQLVFVLLLSSAWAGGPIWGYDPGPSISTPNGRELIDIQASIPYMPGISEELIGKQKFRPQFGPVIWRMSQAPNSVKILFIGQDATHIAEAAGRTATAGFGGRAQDLANYFGVDEGAAFINTYAFTIKGQYGMFETPYLQFDKDGKAQVRFSGFVDNRLWLLTHDQESPVVQWRNNLIDWIIRNNKDSLKLIVLFGGAARDAAATFIESRGGKVGTMLTEERAKLVQIPESKAVYSGGNNEFPVPITETGRDIYAEVAGRRFDYKKVEEQQAAQEALMANLDSAMSKFVLTKGGPLKNGMIHPGQLGGFDLRKISIAGKNTRSLKGLSLADGSKIKDDVLVVQFPHPTALSSMTKEEASERVADALEDLAPYVEAGWKIPADQNRTNLFAVGKNYAYSRADIGPEYYDFGAPASRMVPVSSASRMSGRAHAIVFGTRDRVKFEEAKLAEMEEDKPYAFPPKEELYTARPRTGDLRYVFDSGPGEKFARLMKENLDLKKIFATKSGKTWEADGIDAFYVKSHPDIKDFGHYRGTFVNPRVLILADPDGYDDLITARALTGTRGQYLHGLMEDAGVGDSYLVLKTVPFGMDGATAVDWKTTLANTAEYREKVLAEVIATGKVEMIIADGKNAAAEIKRIIGKKPSVPVISIDRRGVQNDSGLKLAADNMKKLSAFKKMKYLGERRDIPRSHLSYYARLWEGTSGDRVLAAKDKNRGLAFAEVAPKWAWEQNVQLTDGEKAGTKRLIEKLKENRLLAPGDDMEKLNCNDLLTE